MLKPLFKSFLVAALFYIPSPSFAGGEGLLDSNEMVTGIRDVLDKTLSNAVLGKGGSDPSVTYTMTPSEVCQFLNTDDTAMCSKVSENLKIEQRVYSNVKGNVVWTLGYFKVIEMDYDKNKVSLTLDIGSIHGIIGSSSLSTIFGDGAEQLSAFIPEEGKIKISVDATLSSKNIVKVEVLEKIEHTVQVESEDIIVKLPAGTALTLDVDQINQVVNLGWKFDGLKLVAPAAVTGTGSAIAFENDKLSGDLNARSLVETISIQNVNFDTVSLKIDGNEAFTIHSSLPINISAKVGQSPLIQVLNNNVNITATVNTNLVDSTFQGDYRFALSKDDSLSLANDGVGTININNLIVKAPTAVLRDLASLPLSGTAAQTQLTASKIKGQVYVDSSSANIVGAELKNIILADDGITQASLNHGGAVNFNVVNDGQTGAINMATSGLNDLDVNIKTNFANQVLGQGEILELDKTLSLTVDRVDGQFMTHAGGSFEIKQVKLSPDGETGHVVVALDETPLFDLSQTGVIDFVGAPQAMSTMVTFNTAVSVDFEIFSNPFLPVANFHSAIASGTVVTMNNTNDVVVNSGQFVVTSSIVEGELFCSPSNQVGACQIELVPPSQESGEEPPSSPEEPPADP